MKLEGKQITVVGTTYTVHLVHNLVDGNERLDGSVKLEDCLIEIDDSLNEQVANQTLVHEITHAILYAMGNEDVDYDDETIVIPLSNIMYQVLKENDIDVK